MTTYDENTSITRELVAGAIALELLHRPINWERIDQYVNALHELEGTATEG